MNDGSSFDVIKEILVKEFDIAPEDIRPESDLESLGIDSLAVIELIFQVEEKLGMSLPDERVPVKTLGDVVQFLDQLIHQAQELQKAEDTHKSGILDEGHSPKFHAEAK